MARAATTLSRQAQDLQEGLTATTAKVKGYAVAGLVGRDASTGLVAGAVLLLLYAAATALAPYLGSAGAAATIGGLVLMGLGAVIWGLLRRRRPTAGAGKS